MCLCERGVGRLNGWQTMWDNDELWGCVWVWISDEGKKKKQKTKKTGEQELVFMYVCGGAFQQKKKEGKISQREPDLCVCVCVCVCVCICGSGPHTTAFSSVCKFISCSHCVRMSRSYTASEHIFPPDASRAVSDYPAALNTCSSHREKHTSESGGWRRGWGSAASWLITILPVN